MNAEAYPFPSSTTMYKGPFFEWTTDGSWGINTSAGL